MSRNYYTPLNQTPETPAKTSAKETAPTYIAHGAKKDVRKEMDAFHTELMRMIASVQSGQSDLVGHALQLTGSGLLRAIEQMVANPDKPGIQRVFTLLQSDINRRFRQEAEKMLKSGSYPGLKEMAYAL